MLGSTFLGRAPSSPNIEHLYVVLSDPALSGGNVVIVNLTKWRADKDQSCIIEAGEHPFVAERSVVFFAKACVSPVDKIEMALRTGVFSAHAGASAALVRRIQQACMNSRDVAANVKSVLRITLGKPAC